MRFKKAVSILLSMVMLLGTAACSGGTSTQQKSSDKASGSAGGGSSIASVTKPTQITAMLDAGMVQPQQGQKQFLDEFKKETGITLKVTQPNHNEYIQKVKMSFASAEIPDIVEINNDDMVQFANNGALYDISDMVAKSSVFQNIMKNEEAKKTFDSVKVNGKLYACPEEEGTGVVTYIRKDLLDKAKLKVPTNFNEFIAMLRAFSKMKTTDGKPIIPYTAPGIDPQVQNYLPQFYQETTGNWEQQDGKWVDGFTTPAMKQTLTMLQSAYAEGLLDKEIVTNKTSTCRDKWYAGQVGAFTYWAGAWAVTLSDKLKKTTPDAEMVAMPAISGTKYSRRIPATLAITAKSSNPGGIFKYFLEYIHDGKDGTLLWTHGVKDVHYKVDSKGTYQTLPELDDPKSQFTRAIVDIGANLEPNYKDPFTIDNRITASNKVLADSDKVTPLCPPSDSYYKNGGTLQTTRSQLVAKIVVSGLSVDQGLSQYKSLTGSTVSQILNEFNSAKS